MSIRKSENEKQLDNERKKERKVEHKIGKRVSVGLDIKETAGVLFNMIQY